MSGSIAVRNPRTGGYDYEIRPPSAEQLRARGAELRRNQRRWHGIGIDRRIEAMLEWARAAERAAPELAEALSLDTGRRRLSWNEAEGVAKKICRWCELAPGLLAAERTQSRMAPGVDLDVRYVPYPLVSVISPWNFPLSLALIDAIPALIAGCSVIAKPSEMTPRFIAPLKESVSSVPELAAVFELVEGGGETGAELIDLADAVCFTGSVPTGRRVAEHAARRMIPAFLELGGKDPAIVLRSANLETAADAVVRQALVNSGQVCLSLERVYVDRSVFDAFVDLLVEKASAAGINAPGCGGVLGPIISRAQVGVIEAQLVDAVEQGAEILCGGEIEGNGGSWLPPTVVTNVDHGMKLMRDETFGPIIPVMPFDGLDEAVALANDTEFGLSAAVFAGTVDEAVRIAERINAGGVSINDAGLQSVTTEAEKNSFGLSGIGPSRMGAAGMMRFFRKKAIMIQNGPPRTIMDFVEHSQAPAEAAE